VNPAAGPKGGETAELAEYAEGILQKRAKAERKPRKGFLTEGNEENEVKIELKHKMRRAAAPP
jgi:hypothetical protein